MRQFVGWGMFWMGLMALGVTQGLPLWQIGVSAFLMFGGLDIMFGDD